MFFSRKTGHSVLVLDIGSASVGGGLAYCEEGKPAIMCYTVRVGLERGDSDALTNAMLHALEEVGHRLLREGAPMLRQHSGSGRIDKAVISISSPWQESKVATRAIQRNEKTFTYTKALEKEALTAGEPPEGRILREEVLATFLNGYLVKEPYGREVSRAELVVLSSTLEKRIIEAIEGVLATLFRVRDITYTSFASPCYSVLSSLYPHEHDFLVLRVEGGTTEVASMKRGHLIDVGSLAHGTDALKEGIRQAGISLERPAGNTPAAFVDSAHNARFEEASNKAEASWVEALAGLLRAFAIRHALPRMVFLIAEDGSRDFLKGTLDAPALRALWLSDEPVSVVPILPKQFSAVLKTQGLAEGDVPLAILALYTSEA